MEECPATLVGHSSGGTLRVKTFRLAKLQDTARLTPSLGSSAPGAGIRSVSGNWQGTADINLSLVNHFTYI